MLPRKRLLRTLPIKKTAFANMPLPMWQQCLLLWQPRHTLLAPIGQVANQAVLPLTPTSERPTPPIRKLYLFDYNPDFSSATKTNIITGISSLTIRIVSG
ncbi:hypothetical protein J6590_069476 [Homalodisca vitripennis]|nr:hypothetical protein J6590_069476 [Homalodisca vitripennis]